MTQRNLTEVNHLVTFPGQLTNHLRITVACPRIGRSTCNPLHHSILLIEQQWNPGSSRCFQQLNLMPLRGSTFIFAEFPRFLHSSQTEIP